MKRKKCRRRVKAELKAIKGSTAPRDVLRRRWIVGKCWNCMGCIGLLAKLAAKHPTLTP